MLRNLIFYIFIFCVAFQLSAQNSSTKVGKHGKFSYEYVENDPLNVRLYTLENGLKVYLSVYKDEPKIQTYIAVRAGSKNDPADATGLAHYLEHILFKGTSQIGTMNWEKEQTELKKIEALYEVYRRTSDTTLRKQLYAQIDSISIVASSYSIANEYDKLMSSIGAEGTNAYTFVEQTVYVNTIPSNQLNKWLAIEANRFQEVVPRLFHTELEAVYEEKNKGMDQDRRKVWEKMLAGLFQEHTYGTQTTIGTVEHLKNPSISEIKKYFNKYYIPNNVAICLSGDIDPEQTIEQINNLFGKWKRKDIPTFNPPVEKPISAPRVIDVFGPDAESVMLAFRLNGLLEKNTKDLNDVYYLKILSMMMTNGQAGLIDLNLNQRQAILGGYAYDLPLNDYAIFAMYGKPREGQSLEEVKELLLAQLDSVKNGKFDDWLIDAVINDYKTSKLKEYQNNKSRADALVSAFINYMPWEVAIAEIDSLKKVTKVGLMAFVKRNFNQNYVQVNKFTGQDTTIQKVPKPKISPVALNREEQSDFFKKIEKMSTLPLSPVFVDYSKDLTIVEKEKGYDILYKKNEDDDLFNLIFVWEGEGKIDPLLPLASSYMSYIGTPKYAAEDLKKELFKLGCNFSFSSSNESFYISLSGLNENLNQTLDLLKHFIQKATPDEQVLENLVNDILKSRKDNKSNKGTIHRSAMVNYAKYGAINPFNDIISEKALKKITGKELLAHLRAVWAFKPVIYYYGKSDVLAIQSAIDKTQLLKKSEGTIPVVKKYDPINIKENIVYFVDYDMVQAEILFLSMSEKYNAQNVPVVTLFNEYFGGSMGSIVFQELRESRALAYSVYSRYSMPAKKDDESYNVSYIGTQSDKIIEAIDGMNGLLDSIPFSEVLFNNSKKSINESLASSRITKSSVLSSYTAAKRLGLNYDIRKDVYEQLPNFSIDDIVAFQKKYIKGQPKAYLVIGSKEKIAIESLQKYGKVITLSLEELFGY